MAREPQDPRTPDPEAPLPRPGGGFPAPLASRLCDRLPDPLLLVDEVGAVVACNHTAERFLGSDRAALVGVRVDELFDPGSRAEVQAMIAAGWSWVAEGRFSLEDGRVVGLNACAVDATDLGGGPVYAVSLHDLTTRRVLDEAEDQRRRMEALSELAGAIARELNDPMSIVQGRLELLLELGVEDPEAVRRHLEVALEHSRRISATLRNLRLVGRTAEPSEDPIPLERAIAEALELVGPRSRSVTVDVRPPDLSVGGEQAMYARVFANLLRRALDQASRTGQVELKAQVERGAITVRITSRSRSRGGDRPAPSDVGSFSIDETLLSSVGGTLRTDATPLETTFLVVLPPAPHRRSRAKRVEDHLLVVGGEALERTVQALLGREGFAIRAVRDGEAALAWLASGPPFDAVVTELLLDGMSGLGLAEHLLRARPELADRVVIVAPTRLDAVPAAAVPLEFPLRKRTLLEALGRRVR